MAATEFSLLTEPWIPVVLTGEERRLVSLRDLFSGQIEVIALRGDSPTQDYAVLRVIIAIYVRAHVLYSDYDLTDARELRTWRREQWTAADGAVRDDQVLEYLSDHADRFDLLSSEVPFMQVADLRTKTGGQLSVRRLIPEAEGDRFTMRAGAGAEFLGFAEAARWLIHVHAFDYSGIKSGVLDDPRVKNGKSYPIGTGWSGYTGGTTILGRNLRQTLMLNCPDSVFLESDEDLPAWEREPDRPGARAAEIPQGACDLMTWQSRRARLHHNREYVTGCMVTNGDRIPEAGANVLNDPMTPHRYSTNKSSRTQDVFYPQPYSPERTMWKALEPLVSLGGDVPLEKKAKPGKRPQNLDWFSAAARSVPGVPTLASVRLTSMTYGPQAATITEVVDATVELPAAVLQEENAYARQAVLGAARSTLDAGIAIGSFAGWLLQAAGDEYVFQAPATDSFLAMLEQSFRKWLRTVPTDDTEQVDAAVADWHTQVFQAATDQAAILIKGAGPRALIGRTIPEGEGMRTHSAATALSRLRRSLTKTLARATQIIKTEKEIRHDG